MSNEDVDVNYEWKELMAMRNEDRDVRYDSPWCRGHHFFPDGLCWLCLRPFSDSDGNIVVTCLVFKLELPGTLALTLTLLRALAAPHVGRP